MFKEKIIGLIENKMRKVIEEMIKNIDIKFIYWNKYKKEKKKMVYRKIYYKLKFI